jgi:hypothetical protein
MVSMMITVFFLGGGSEVAVKRGRGHVKYFSIATGIGIIRSIEDQKELIVRDQEPVLFKAHFTRSFFFMFCLNCVNRLTGNYRVFFLFKILNTKFMRFLYKYNFLTELNLIIFLLICFHKVSVSYPNDICLGLDSTF